MLIGVSVGEEVGECVLHRVCVRGGHVDRGECRGGRGWERVCVWICDMLLLKFVFFMLTDQSLVFKLSLYS